MEPQLLQRRSPASFRFLHFGNFRSWTVPFKWVRARKRQALRLWQELVSLPEACRRDPDHGGMQLRSRGPLGLERLDGLTFLDIGSGSGLSSLAAHRLGASVHSFDYDPEFGFVHEGAPSDKFGSSSTSWTIEQGSALDASYLAQSGKVRCRFLLGGFSIILATCGLR